MTDTFPGKPFVGNLLDIPKVHSWLRFKEWTDEYGPIFQLNIACRKHVVISQEKIANDLLRERGSLYSSREYLPFASGLLSDNLRPLLLPYNGLLLISNVSLYTPNLCLLPQIAGGAEGN